MFLSKVIPLALLLAVAGCSTTPNQIKGSHNYESREFNIKVTVHDTNRKLNRVVGRKYGELNNGYSVEGFSIWYITEDASEMETCELHVVRPEGPEDNYEFSTWGHELAHCVYGTFHPHVD